MNESERSSGGVPTRQTAFDYDRTVVAFHGTRRAAARSLIRGEAFGVSENDDDWLGHGIYLWEYAPQQAWWWARRRYGADAAVVGSLVRLGRCLDLLDPSNTGLLGAAHDDLNETLAAAGQKLPANANNHKLPRLCRVQLALRASRSRRPPGRQLPRGLRAVTVGKDAEALDPQWSVCRRARSALRS